MVERVADLPLGASFGELLRQFRQRAGLTQEELAERANVSVRAISDLERGAKQTPHRTTVALLASALSLSPEEETQLEGSIRRGRGPASVLAEQRTLSSLPEPPTSLVGRDRDVMEVCHRIRWSGIRLLTLTGPGGVGKTRVAIAAAHALREAYPAGPMFVPLASLRDARLVAPSIAMALGLQDAPSRPPEEVLTEHLKGREAVIVLDNLEHLPEAAPLLSLLLRECPLLKLIVTSRTAIKIQGEHRMEIAPLEVPGKEAHARTDAAAGYPAVDLFAQRARAARRGFAPTDANLASIIEICRRLDGLPLAIELAAAHIAHLSPQALLMRLDRRLPLLTDGPSDLPARQQTMWNAIAWSYDLLAEPEQRLLRRLAVFAGSWNLEAAEAVCGDMASSGVFEQLSALIDRSLVLLDDQTELEPRYRMLETVHEYTGEQLDASGERRACRDRHLTYFLRLVEEAEPHLTGSGQATWIPRLEADRDNLLAALQWALEQNRIAEGLTVLTGSRLLWEQHGPLGEMRRWFERFLAAEQHAGSAVDDRLRVKTLTGLGRVSAFQGDTALAEQLYRQALSLASAADDPAAVSRALNLLAGLAHEAGDTDRAMALYQDALAAATAASERWHMAAVCTNLGNLVMDLGQLDQAVVWLYRALDLLRELDEKRVMGMNLNVLGEIYRQQGMPDRAKATFREALRLLHEVTDLMNLAYSLDCLARIARDDGTMVWAVQLMGAAERLRAAIGVSSDPDVQAIAGQVLADCERELGAAGVAAALEEGAAMALDDVVARALGAHATVAPILPHQDAAPAT
jgi:predicted ATPase/transcriptional regulator with XRE-family HTH domain/Tfp pilus assembly protein PilF